MVCLSVYCKYTVEKIDRVLTEPRCTIYLSTQAQVYTGCQLRRRMAALVPSHRTHTAIIASSLRQNDVATSFWRNSGVIIMSRSHWDVVLFKSLQLTSKFKIWALIQHKDRFSGCRDFFIFFFCFVYIYILMYIHSYHIGIWKAIWAYWQSRYRLTNNFF